MTFTALLNIKPSTPNVNGHVYSCEVVGSLLAQLNQGAYIVSETPSEASIELGKVIGRTIPVTASFNKDGRWEVQVELYDKGCIVERIGREFKARTMVLGMNTIAELNTSGEVLMPITLISLTPMVPN
jgi:hypothetical protein